MLTFNSRSNLANKAIRSVKVVTAVIGATAIGGLVLTACSNQPDDNTAAKYVPANAESFVTVAFSPSVKQKASLLVMSQHLPSDVHAKQAGQVRDNLLTDLFKSSQINYSSEIKPWLGTEAAFATLPPVDGTNVPIVVGAVQAKDEKKAEATLANHHVDSASYRYLKGYIFFVDTDQIKAHQATKALDEVALVANGKAKSLQSMDRYKANIKTLHGEHIILGWVDVPALVKLGIAAEKADEVKQAAAVKAEKAQEQADEKANDDNLDSGTTGSIPDDGSDDGSSAGDGSAASDGSIASGNDLAATATAFSAADSSSSVPDDSSSVPDDSSSSLGGLSSLLGLADSANADDSATINPELDKLQASANATGSYSFEIYAATSGVVFEGVTEHAGTENGATSNRPLLNSLPKDIVGAVDVADFGTDASKVLDTLTKGVNGANPIAPTLDKDTPQIREVVKTLSGEAVGVVGSGSPTPVGLVAGVADTAGASKAVSDLVGALTSKYGVAAKPVSISGGTGYDLTSAAPLDLPDPSSDDPSSDDSALSAVDSSDTHLYVAVANHRLVISSTSSQAQLLVRSDGDFGTSDNQTQAFGSEPHLTFGAVYVNLRSAIAMAQKDADKTSNTAAQKWLDALDVAGAQVWSDSAHDYTEVRVTFK